MNSLSRRWRLLLALFGIFALFVSACGDDDDTTDDTTDETDDDAGDEGDDAEGDEVSLPILDIRAVDTTTDDGGTGHAFEVPEGVTAGPAQINLINESSEIHHVQFFKLNDGVTMDDVGAALATGEETALFPLGTFTGGTGITNPGGESSADAILGLEEGTYVLLCFIANDEGVPHLALGMVEPLVVGPAEGEVAEMPTPDATVSMIDFGYDTTELPAGSIVEIVNDSAEQPHEMMVAALEDGAEPADIGAFFAGEIEGPPPFAAVGGMQALPPGGSQLLLLEVEAGSFAIFCAIPDPADGVPHIAKGMLSPLTVS